jgi:hypothetical protein
MTQKNNNKIISAIHSICYGLDVHKNLISACIITSYRYLSKRRPNDA